MQNRRQKCQEHERSVCEGYPTGSTPAQRLASKKRAGGFRLRLGFHGGDSGIRTRDPRVANAMLSQLSYIPINKMQDDIVPENRADVKLLSQIKSPGLLLDILPFNLVGILVGILVKQGVQVIRLFVVVVEKLAKERMSILGELYDTRQNIDILIGLT